MTPENGILLIFRHAWILFLFATCVNAAAWWKRGQHQIAVNPHLEPGYRRLVRGWLVFGNIPWLVMGAGVLFGGLQSVFQFFNPRNGPFVVAWYVSVVAVWILAAYWLFFRRGAEQLIEYPGLLNLPTKSPWLVKLMFVVCLAGGIAGLAAMIFGNIQGPLVK
jgi:hypothetical protein